MAEIQYEMRILDSKAPYTGDPIGKQGKCILTWIKPKCWSVWVLVDVSETKGVSDETER